MKGISRNARVVYRDPERPRLCRVAVEKPENITSTTLENYTLGKEWRAHHEYACIQTVAMLLLTNLSPKRTFSTAATSSEAASAFKT